MRLSDSVIRSDATVERAANEDVKTAGDAHAARDDARSLSDWAMLFVAPLLMMLLNEGGVVAVGLGPRLASTTR